MAKPVRPIDSDYLGEGIRPLRLIDSALHHSYEFAD